MNSYRHIVALNYDLQDYSSMTSDFQSYEGICEIFDASLDPA